MNGGTLLMSKLSKEEILKMVENMADSDGVDIEELYSSAKEKLGETNFNDVSTFNKEAFAEVLEMARGGRSVTEFGEDSDVSVAHISRFLRKLVDTPPSEETLRKIANIAYNEVSYTDLVNATQGTIKKGICNNFSKSMFSKMLQKAIGRDSISEFADSIHLKNTYIADLIDGKINTAPTEDVLQDIANCNSNGVTFEQLKEATKGNINEPASDTDVNKSVTSAQLEDFLADEDNKQNITERVEAMTDAEKDFHRDTEMSPMPKSYRHKENELVQTNFYGAEHNSVEDGAFGIPRAHTA